jgi:molecular chaperone HtpG
LDSEPEKYEKFYKSFGIQLKYGLLNSYGAKRELLSDHIYSIHPKRRNDSHRRICKKNAGRAEIYLLYPAVTAF